MKTIREWFESVSDTKLKEELLYELDRSTWGKENLRKCSLAEALRKGFRWGNTDKGHSYWDDICLDMDKNPEKYTSQYVKQKSKLNI